MTSSRVVALPTCSICQDEDGGLDIVTTTCGHTFHSACIRQWDSCRRALRQCTKCPSCNVDLMRPTGSMNSRFIRLHSLYERTLNSASTQPQSESELALRWQECNLELAKLKETIKQNEAKVRELTQEPESLKRERDALQLQIKKLERTIHDMDVRKQAVAHERQRERKQLIENRNFQFIENKRLQTEIEKLNDKCRNLKSDRDQLQEQLTAKTSENEELQSFVSDFSKEKKRLEMVESELKTQLQDSIKQAKTLMNANKAFDNKLKETKDKVNFLENQLGNPVVSTVATRSNGASIRHCSKFYPEASKTSIIPTNGVIMTPKAQGKQPDNSVQSSIKTISSNPTKRFRTNNKDEDSQLMEIRSDSDDIVICSTSSPHNLHSSPPPHYNNKAEQNIILPYLFGSDPSKHNRRTISSPHHHEKSVHQQPPRLLKNSSANLGTSSFFPVSNKLIALGPKIRHR